MTKEEIIEKIRDNVIDNESTYILCDALEDIIKNNNKKYDIQIIVSGLLDLYQQEKEKNIPLIIDGKSINAYADEIEDLLSIEDGTPIYFSIGERQAIKIISQYCRNSIPKHKIKEQLIELDNMKVDGEVFTIAVNFAKKILKKLLEEE